MMACWPTVSSDTLATAACVAVASICRISSTTCTAQKPKLSRTGSVHDGLLAHSQQRHLGHRGLRGRGLHLPDQQHHLHGAETKTEQDWQRA